MSSAGMLSLCNSYFISVRYIYRYFSKESVSPALRKLCSHHQGESEGILTVPTWRVSLNEVFETP